MIDFKELKKISKNFTLLFVEDDLLLRKQTSKIFANLFCLVDTAENGKEGLKLYNNYYEEHGVYYDIIVSDIEMPFIDGIELSKQILQINKNQKIVIMSAYDDKEYLLGLIKMGIEYFMQKPLSTEHLLDTINKLCVSFKDDRSVSFGDGYYFNSFLKILFHEASKIDISYNETMLLELLLSNKKKKFSIDEVFTYIYEDVTQEKSKNELVENMVNRLSEKLPLGVIENNTLGYSLNIA